jgi:hypothetical protein
MTTIPRDERTPESEAAAALYFVLEFLDWTIDLIIDKTQNLSNEVMVALALQKILGEPDLATLTPLIDEFRSSKTGWTSIDIFERVWQLTRDDPGADGDMVTPQGKGFDAMWAFARKTLHYAAQAIQAEKDGRLAMAWSYAIDATHWGAVLSQERLHQEDNPASAMAIKRHSEDYALKEDAIRFWRENINPKLSNEKAATELRRVVPVSHQTLARWVGKAKKGTL